jgi:hypothetical protein
MKFICAQPAIDYYTWQVEVMINNFKRNGINPNNIEIVSSYTGSIPDYWRKLANKYNNVRFFFYKDERKSPKYISSIRPHILHQHWLKYPELEKEVIFYHDCDMLFTKEVNFKNLEEGDTCYLSDTVSYIGARYIESKGNNYLDIMTEIVGVSKEKVIENEKNSGGAQYIIKGINADFWEKVYKDSEEMFSTIVKKQNGNASSPFQIWCADMWAVLWNLWVFNKEVEVHPDMAFSWATSVVADWDRKIIFHNAGVTGDRKDLFNKSAYMNRLPYDDIESQVFNTNFCSFNYVQEIIKTSHITCLK